MANDLPYKWVVLLDTEFHGLPGERQTPVCVVFKEMRTGETIRLWQDQLKTMSAPPFPVGADTVYIAYFSSAEWNTFLQLGWPIPQHIIDFCVEWRNMRNGLQHYARNRLIDALEHFHIPAMSHIEKTEMRDLILSGGPWNADQQQAILVYCESDVIALEKLYPHIIPKVDLPQALLRGAFMAAVARMEWEGVPIDVESYRRLSAQWDCIQLDLIARINWQFYCPYEGTRFRSKGWESYLLRRCIPWPRTASGRLDLSLEAFETMLRQYPQIAPMYNLRFTLGKMRLRNVSIGSDGRNRTLLSPFRARTSRTQPSSAKFVLCAAAMLRGLIRPERGMGLAYVDYSQQEFAIAAALSRDGPMQEAYRTGDPYLSLAKIAGYIPSHATKESHAKERGIYKEACLALQYGLGAETFGNKIGVPPVIAEALLESHKTAFPQFRRWSDDVVRYAALYGRLWSVFGWYRYYLQMNEESSRNFPVQSAGAEMLRLAIILAQAAGVRVVAPLHDAMLIEFPLCQAGEAVELVQQAMQRASELTLKGFPLRSDAKLILFPDRYMDDRGRETWALLWEIVSKIEEGTL